MTWEQEADTSCPRMDGTEGLGNGAGTAAGNIGPLSLPPLQTPGGGASAGGSGGPGLTPVIVDGSGVPLDPAAGAQVMPAPVRAGRGQMELGRRDLSSNGFGQPWGQSRSYGNVEGGAGTGATGRGWMVSEQSSLRFSGGSIEVRRGADQGLWFGDATGGVYRPEVAFHGDLRHDAGAEEYGLTDEAGNRRVYYDNSSGTPAALRGKLKGVVDRYGRRAAVSYDAGNRLAAVSWTGGGDQSEEYGYAYDADGNTSEVTLKVGGQPVRRSCYDYWSDGDEGGSAGDLRRVTVEQWDATGSQWRRVSREFYRYWTDGTNGGGLKYQVSSATYDRMEAEGVDPETASDTAARPVMAGYADRYFEYDGGGRVSKQRTRGGANEYTYDYLENSASPGLGDTNTWAVKTTMSLPGGNEKRYYTNAMGSLLVAAYEDKNPGGNTWFRAYEKNADGFTTQMASSEAVSSVSEPSTGSGTLTVSLKSDAGLIEEYDYAAADDPAEGEVKNFPKSVSVKEGTGGTADRVRKLKWDTRTVDGVSIHPPEETLTYPTAGMSDNDAPKTSFSYTY